MKILLLMILLLMAGCLPRRIPMPPPSPPAVPTPTTNQPPRHRLIAASDPLLGELKAEEKVLWLANEGPDFHYEPEHGKASFYSRPQKMANGKHLDPDAFTAAHRTLPLNTVVRCTRLDDGRSVVLLITDRGPHIRGRIIDLSPAAARKIGITRKGLALCRVDVLAYPM